MAKKLKQGLCMNLEWWDGEGDGREVQKGGDKSIYTYGCFNLEVFGFHQIWSFPPE